MSLVRSAENTYADTPLFTDFAHGQTPKIIFNTDGRPSLTKEGRPLGNGDFSSEELSVLDETDKREAFLDLSNAEDVGGSEAKVPAQYDKMKTLKYIDADHSEYLEAARVEDNSDTSYWVI